MNNKIRIYFLGSGKIGIPSLENLYKSNDFELVGIGTQVDRTGGRKNKIISTPVAVWTEENNLDVEKIPSVNSPEFLEHLEQLDIDILLVASFGQILKAKLLDLPKIDCVNIHASILPKYRGASPIAAAILKGDETCGVAFMKMERGLDSGPVYSVHEYQMQFNENAEELEDILGNLAGENAVEVLKGICDGDIKPVEQDHEKATNVWKIKKHYGSIDWNLYAEYIERMVRAYYPWPGAFFTLKSGKRVRKIQITAAEVCECDIDEVGVVVAANKNEWVISCGKNALRILKLIPEGKNEMTGPEFLRGCQFKEGQEINNE